ncbi:Calcium-binding protein KIC [Acorus calamus]|uniref:Calcium-binding protein KIC n=1 Tax=Acorus calamus TaxID=4465 RepID=A0AAV9FK41_ACOCL|nr:Calcium-binding protein KIC [Acorus calamus]KAK1325916.1 Calcium-binding protein KIC [Acorus calamus]
MAAHFPRRAFPSLPPLFKDRPITDPPQNNKTQIFNSLKEMALKAFEFEDFLPKMAEKLGEEGLMGELCNGFRLLMDPMKGLITFESLKRNSGLLGLQGLSDDELLSMLREGDMDGDGALNETEFCVLMFRLSPDLMEESKRWVEEAIEEEMEDFMSEFL